MLRRTALASTLLARAAAHEHAAPALATLLGPQPRRRFMMVQEPGTRDRPHYDKCVPSMIEHTHQGQATLQ